MAFEVSAIDRGQMDQIMRGEGSSFSRQLIRLIPKADAENRERLRLAFPDHVRVYEEWYSQPRNE